MSAQNNNLGISSVLTLVLVIFFLSSLVISVFVVTSNDSFDLRRYAGLIEDEDNSSSSPSLSSSKNVNDPYESGGGRSFTEPSSGGETYDYPDGGSSSSNSGNKDDDNKTTTGSKSDDPYENWVPYPEGYFDSLSEIDTSDPTRPTYDGDDPYAGQETRFNLREEVDPYEVHEIQTAKEASFKGEVTASEIACDGTSSHDCFTTIHPETGKITYHRNVYYNGKWITISETEDEIKTRIEESLPAWADTSEINIDDYYYYGENPDKAGSIYLYIDYEGIYENIETPEEAYPEPSMDYKSYQGVVKELKEDKQKRHTAEDLYTNCLGVGGSPYECTPVYEECYLTGECDFKWEDLTGYMTSQDAYRDCLKAGGSTSGCTSIYEGCYLTGECDFTEQDLIDSGIVIPTTTEQELANAGIIPITEQDIIDSGASPVIQEYLEQQYLETITRYGTQNQQTTFNQQQPFEAKLAAIAAYNLANRQLAFQDMMEASTPQVYGPPLPPLLEQQHQYDEFMKEVYSSYIPTKGYGPSVTQGGDPFNLIQDPMGAATLEAKLLETISKCGGNIACQLQAQDAYDRATTTGEPGVAYYLLDNPSMSTSEALEMLNYEKGQALLIAGGASAGYLAAPLAYGLGAGAATSVISTVETLGLVDALTVATISTPYIARTIVNAGNPAWVNLQSYMVFEGFINDSPETPLAGISQYTTRDLTRNYVYGRAVSGALSVGLGILAQTGKYGYWGVRALDIWDSSNDIRELGRCVTGGGVDACFDSAVSLSIGADDFLDIPRIARDVSLIGASKVYSRVFDNYTFKDGVDLSETLDLDSIIDMVINPVTGKYEMANTPSNTHTVLELATSPNTDIVLANPVNNTRPNIVISTSNIDLMNELAQLSHLPDVSVAAPDTDNRITIANIPTQIQTTVTGLLLAGQDIRTEPAIKDQETTQVEQPTQIERITNPITDLANTLRTSVQKAFPDTPKTNNQAVVPAEDQIVYLGTGIGNVADMARVFSDAKTNTTNPLLERAAGALYIVSDRLATILSQKATSQTETLIDKGENPPPALSGLLLPANQRVDKYQSLINELEQKSQGFYNFPTQTEDLWDTKISLGPPSVVNLLRSSVGGRTVIDLGGGNFSAKFTKNSPLPIMQGVAQELNASTYVLVDRYLIPSEDSSSLDPEKDYIHYLKDKNYYLGIMDDSKMTISYRMEDMLRFLSYMPDETILNGKPIVLSLNSINNSLIPDYRYHERLAQEIVRVLPIDGVMLTANSEAPKYFEELGLTLLYGNVDVGIWTKMSDQQTELENTIPEQPTDIIVFNNEVEQESTLTRFINFINPETWKANLLGRFGLGFDFINNFEVFNFGSERIQPVDEMLFTSWDSIIKSPKATVITMEQVELLPKMIGRKVPISPKIRRGLYPVEIVSALLFSSNDLTEGRVLIQEYLNKLKLNEDVDSYTTIAENYFATQEDKYDAMLADALTREGKRFAEEAKVENPNQIPTENIDDIVLVRVMAEEDLIGLDNNGNVVIQHTFLGQTEKNNEVLLRTSKHFSLNGVVRPVTSATVPGGTKLNDWTAKDVIILAPMNEFVKINGPPNTSLVQDTWWTPGVYDNLILPRGTIIVIREDSPLLNTYSKLPGVVIIKSKQPFKDANSLIEQAGYVYKAQGTEFSQVTKPSEQFLHQGVFAWKIGADSNLHSESAHHFNEEKYQSFFYTGVEIQEKINKWKKGELSLSERVQLFNDLIKYNYFGVDDIFGINIPNTKSGAVSNRIKDVVRITNWGTDIDEVLPLYAPESTMIKIFNLIYQDKVENLPDFLNSEGVFQYIQTTLINDRVDPSLPAVIPLLSPSELFGLTDNQISDLRSDVNEKTRLNTKNSSYLIGSGPAQWFENWSYNYIYFRNPLAAVSGATPRMIWEGISEWTKDVSWSILNSINNLLPSTLQINLHTNIQTEIQVSQIISPEAVDRLTTQEASEEWDFLTIITKGQNAMNIMPEKKVGIVLGSGPNTQKWKRKGWKTLDINPEANADYTIDANYLESVIPESSLDYILAEYINFDRAGRVGVSPSRLLNQANKALINGGILIIQSASFENVPIAKIPSRFQFAELLAAHGFEAVTVLDTYNTYGRNKREQEVVYYAKKVAEGYDATRKINLPEKYTFDAQTGMPILSEMPQGSTIINVEEKRQTTQESLFDRISKGLFSPSNILSKVLLPNRLLNNNFPMYERLERTTPEQFLTVPELIVQTHLFMQKIGELYPNGQLPDTIFFLDKSARPVSHLFRKLISTYYPNQITPQIRFINIGGQYFDARKQSAPFSGNAQIIRDTYGEHIDQGGAILVVDEFTTGTFETIDRATTAIQEAFPQAQVQRLVAYNKLPNWYQNELFLGVEEYNRYDYEKMALEKFNNRFGTSYSTLNELINDPSPAIQDETFVFYNIYNEIFETVPYVKKGDTKHYVIKDGQFIYLSENEFLASRKELSIISIYTAQLYEKIINNPTLEQKLIENNSTGISNKELADIVGETESESRLIKYINSIVPESWKIRILDRFGLGIVQKSPIIKTNMGEQTSSETNWLRSTSETITGFFNKFVTTFTMNLGRNNLAYITDLEPPNQSLIDLSTSNDITNTELLETNKEFTSDYISQQISEGNLEPTSYEIFIPAVKDIYQPGHPNEIKAPEGTIFILDLNSVNKLEASDFSQRTVYNYIIGESGTIVVAPTTYKNISEEDTGIKHIQLAHHLKLETGENVVLAGQLGYMYTGAFYINLESGSFSQEGIFKTSAGVQPYNDAIPSNLERLEEIMRRSFPDHDIMGINYVLNNKDWEPWIQ